MAESLDPEALQAAFRERCGAELAGLRRVGQLVHVFTHRRLTCEVFAATVLGEVRATGVHYLDVRVVRDPEELALSTLARKILAAGTDPAGAEQPALPFAAEPRLRTR
jgi:adenine-specific DNA glycosylase